MKKEERRQLILQVAGYAAQGNEGVVNELLAALAEADMTIRLNEKMENYEEKRRNRGRLARLVKSRRGV